MPRAHRPPSRIPPFLAVPLRTRADGWTPLRQAEFIGFLAESGCVRTAAQGVGMTREGAYRLRARPGAAGFAAAWNAALAQGDTGDNTAWKVTHEELRRRAYEGVWRVVMRRGRYVGAVLRLDNTALLQVIARLGRGEAADGAAAWPELFAPTRNRRPASTGTSPAPALHGAQPSLTSPSSSPSQ